MPQRVDVMWGQSGLGGAACTKCLPPVCHVRTCMTRLFPRACVHWFAADTAVGCALQGTLCGARAQEAARELRPVMCTWAGTHTQAVAGRCLVENSRRLDPGPVLLCSPMQTQAAVPAWHLTCDCMPSSKHVHFPTLLAHLSYPPEQRDSRTCPCALGTSPCSVHEATA